MILKEFKELMLPQIANVCPMGIEGVNPKR
jgi:hypothetical protein